MGIVFPRPAEPKKEQNESNKEALRELVEGRNAYQKMIDYLLDCSEQYADDPEIEQIDFRIQLDSGVIRLHTGDSGYDTDHLGIWGAGEIMAGDDAKAIRSSLEDAFEQLAEGLALQTEAAD